jgi:predicted SAM-dependent methyltransferase
MKLHLGCGKVILPGFTNIDVRGEVGVNGIDIVGPVDVLGFPDSSVDLIYACHVLEHLHRVLKPEGTLRISIPDFTACVMVYGQTFNLGLLLGHLVGGQEYPENTHYMVFDFIYLSTLLSEVGFRRIRRYDWRNTEHSEIDDRSQGYYPHMDKEHGTLMSLNVEADK